jgi:hypothetical protein
MAYLAEETPRAPIICDEALSGCGSRGERVSCSGPLASRVNLPSPPGYAASTPPAERNSFKISLINHPRVSLRRSRHIRHDNEKTIQLATLSDLRSALSYLWMAVVVFALAGRALPVLRRAT